MWTWPVQTAGVYECRARGIFRKEKRKPLVGDDVEIEVISQEEKTGNLIDILPPGEANSSVRRWPTWIRRW